MKQKLKPETWVGIFLIAGILMIIGVILGFGNIKTSKEQTYPINIIFKDAAGLIKDSQIRLGGVTVGKVTKAPELLPSGNEVMLEASIQSDVKIQQGSVFRVDMQNILGDKYIDIVPPAQPTHEYILPHATIIGQRTQGQIARWDAPVRRLSGTSKRPCRCPEGRRCRWNRPIPD